MLSATIFSSPKNKGLKMNKLIIFVLVFLPVFVLADGPVETVNSATSTLNNWLIGAGATIAIILEFVFRLLPTKKPLGWFYLAASLIKAIAGLLMAVAAFLDRVLPQNVVPVEPQKVAPPVEQPKV
jgi:hypothetical protein